MRLRPDRSALYIVRVRAAVTLDRRTILLLLLALVVSGVIAWIRVSTTPVSTAPVSAGARRAAPSASAPDAGYTVEVEVGP